MNPLLTAALAVAAPPAGWEAAFRHGTADPAPTGPTRGTVLYAAGRHPRLKARVQGALWKGKAFHADGTFTNRWAGGVRAGTVGTRVEPSWLDGQPSLVAEYPPSAPVFGGVRDEIRSVAPGVWVGTSYDTATGRAKNWFLLRGK